MDVDDDLLIPQQEDPSLDNGEVTKRDGLNFK